MKTKQKKALKQPFYPNINVTFAPMMTKKQTNTLIIIAVLLIVGLTAAALYGYKAIFGNNVNTENVTYIYIPTHASYEQVIDTLQAHQVLKDIPIFRMLAQKKHYPTHIHAGKYKITANMSNNELVNMLRSGKQEPVKLTFNNIRTKEQLCQRISEQLECTAEELLQVLNDEHYWTQYGFTAENCMAMFIPNTYEFWWNTSANAWVERMYKEYTRFWNHNRNTAAQNIPLSRIEVSILAAIVEEENHMATEQPVIAGLYINRLHKHMPLQSDPTLKYAIGDFGIKRLLNKDKQIDSPYNTYTHIGLTPGPIRIPSIQAIDAVLHYQKHNYLYMCAKEDFSGKHNFAATLTEHERNAARYHTALNNKGIKR